jgi:predicted nucleotidyltransferase
MPIHLLSPEVARKRAERAARALATDPRVELVILFGSAADSRRRSVGDVDLAVLTRPVLTFQQQLNLAADAVLAAGGDLDVVFLNDAPVVLAREIADTGRCLYAASPYLEADFVTRARMRHLDFRHLLDEQWRLTGERLEARRHGPAS